MFKKISILFLFSSFLIYGQIDDKIWSISYHLSNASTFNGPTIINRYTSSSSQALLETDTRIHPTQNTMQSEMSIALSPIDNNILLASANASDYPRTTFYGTGVYWSTNGGANWQGHDEPPFFIW